MYDFSFTEVCDQGGSFGLSLELVDSDISGCEIYSQIKNSLGDLVANFNVTVTDALSGKFDIDLEENNLSIGTYYCDILFVYAGKKRHSHVFKLLIKRSVTNEHS